MDYNDLLITTGEAREIVMELFNIDGRAKSLPGELDFNFKIDSVDGNEYILKISRTQENGAYLDFQQQLLRHIADHGMDLIGPNGDFR